MTCDRCGVDLGLADREAARHAVEHAGRVIEIPACPCDRISRDADGFGVVAAHGTGKQRIHQCQTQYSPSDFAVPTGPQTMRAAPPLHGVAPTLLEPLLGV